MRILYFMRGYTTHDRRFLLKIAESHHEVWYLPLEGDSVPLERRALADKVHVLPEPLSPCRITHPDDVLPLMPDFSRILERVRPDLIHAGPVQTCGYMAALSGSTPFLLMSWGSDMLMDADRDDHWREVTRFTLNRADCFLCDCDAVRNKASELAAFGEKRIIQFPWGVNLNDFRPDGRELGLRATTGWRDAVIVLSTRSWEPIYGIDVLIRAFALAHREHPALRLVLLAGGSLEAEVQRLIAESGLEDAVYRPGMVSNDLLPELFRSADIYLSCSYTDGSSISLLEAMATSLPAVVTDGPGNNEWIIPHKNGWLAPAGDAAAFADRLLTAARMRRGDRLAMGRVNRQVAECRANWDLNSRKLLDTYQTMEAGAMPVRASS